MRAAASNPTLLIIIFAYDCEAKNTIKENLKKGGSTGNNNILVLSPEDYRNSQEDKFKKELNNLNCFDLQSINEFVFNAIKHGIF